MKIFSRILLAFGRSKQLLSLGTLDPDMDAIIRRNPAYLAYLTLVTREFSRQKREKEMPDGILLFRKTLNGRTKPGDVSDYSHELQILTKQSEKENWLLMSLVVAIDALIGTADAESKDGLLSAQTWLTARGTAIGSS